MSATEPQDPLVQSTSCLYYRSRCPAKGISQHVCPSKTKISAQADQSLMGPLYVAKSPKFLKAEN